MLRKPVLRVPYQVYLHMYPRMCKLRNPQHSNVPTTAQFRRATQLRSRSDGLDGANELPGLSVCEAGTYIVRERVKIPIESTLTGSTELCDPRTEGARHYIVRVSYPPLAIRVRRARERSYGTCRTVVVQIKDALHSICAKHGNSRVTPPRGCRSSGALARALMILLWQPFLRTRHVPRLARDPTE